MVVATISQNQVVSPGTAIIFDSFPVARQDCCSKIPGSIKLCKNGNYEITFSGNIVGTGGSQTLSIEVSGIPIPGGRIDVVPASGNVNVSATTGFHRCCGDLSRVSVINTGSDDITVVAGSTLVIR